MAEYYVLDEIISVMISQQLMTEIMKPQAAYTHESVKNLIEDITQSSAMRLDPKSMDKLWDLITMVLKWQMHLTTDILRLTSRHLYEIENYVTNEETQLQLHKVQNLYDNFAKILNSDEQNELRDCVNLWLADFNVRVSLLLRLGLQDSDGSFVTENLNPFAQDMLKNLGENIYSVSQNGKYGGKIEKIEKNETEGFELKLLVDQIVGEKQEKRSSNQLKLSINQKDVRAEFDCINTESNGNGLEEFLEDLSLNEERNGDFHEELIGMIGSED